MCEVALAAKRGGADSIATINTVKSITNIDLNKIPGCRWLTVNPASPVIQENGKRKPIALRFIQQLRMHTLSCTRFPQISGIGGIDETGEGALPEFPAAGRGDPTGDDRRYAIRLPAL